jgi:DNA-binding transcriptional regulator GbsR (MarR family)
MASKQPESDEPSEELLEAQELCIETMGRLAEFWGFTRTMGRVYGALFLSERAMSQAEIVERLGVSTANVSMSLKGLQRWGAVHKGYERGSRKHHYTAEPELRKIIRTVMGSRESRELGTALEDFQDAGEILKLKRRRRKKLPEDEAFALERIAHLENVARISNKLLELLLGGGRVDVKRELGER